MRRPTHRFAALNGGIIAAGICLMTFTTLAGLNEGWMTRPVSSAPLLQTASPCTVEPSTSLDALTVAAVGETIGVTFTAKTTCPSDDVGPLHIVFVMQASAPMARDVDTGDHPQAEMKAAAIQAVEALNLEENPWVKVGVVEYNDAGNQLCALTNNQEELEDCIGDVRATGETNTVRGIDAGMTVLTRGRRAAPPGLSEVLFLFGDMTNDFRDPRTSVASADGVAAPRQSGCDPIVEAVDEIKAESPDMVFGTVCVGGCDLTCARRIATSSGFAFNTDRIETLLTTMGRIVESVRGAPVKSVTVDVTLDDSMAYVEGSAIPGATIEDGHVIWEIRGSGALDAAVEMRLAPTIGGSIGKACASAEGLLVDGSDRELTFTLECPEITVSTVEATPTLTPEPTEPATDTPEPATPEPGETPTPEPTPATEPSIFMPLSHNGESSG